MAHMLFYSYIRGHETTRERSSVGTPPPTGHPTVAPEEVRVGHSSIACGVQELHRPMARGVQETWLRGTPSQTDTRASTPLEPGTESEVGKVSVERPDGSWVFNRFMDLAADLQTDRKTLPCELSPKPCLAAATEHGMELSETGTPGTPERRRGHCALGSTRVASDKKKPHDLAPISYSWMKAGFCSSPMCDALGLQEARHRTSTIGSSRTESLPLGPSASLQVGGTLDCTCSSARAASNIVTSRFSCSISSGTCADRSCCCGIGERSTVIMPSEHSLTNAQDCIQNSSLLMRLNSIQPNTSGIEPTLLSPIPFPPLSHISTADSTGSHASSEAPRNASRRVFMQADCLGDGDTAFLYLCEAQ